jgi:hypothetical protein
MPGDKMVQLETLEETVKAHVKDPNYELGLNTLSELLKIEDPLQDRITTLIGNLSPNEFNSIQKSISYKDCWCEDYKCSRGEWFETAKKLKGGKLTPDEALYLADKHRIHYAVTHPRGMHVMVHDSFGEEAITKLLWKVVRTLGPEKCRALGYCFEATEE